MTEPAKTAPGEVAAVGPDGSPITLPAAAVPQLQASGGHVMTPAEEAAARHGISLDQELSGLEGYVAPPLAGAARGLTFGLSDQLGKLSPAVRKRLADYQEYAPTASTGGEIAGMVGGAMLGVGPAGWAARGGRALEAGVAEGIGGGLLGKIGGGAAAGAFENGLYGAGSAISESAIKNTDLTGEALIGGAAHGALGGMLMGGVLGAAGKGISALRGKPSASALESLAAGHFGEPAPGVGRALADEVGASDAIGPYRRASERGAADPIAQTYIENLPTSTPGEQVKQTEAWGNRSKVFGKHAETLEGATRDFSSALNDTLEAGRKTDMASFGEAKVNQMSELVDQSKFDAQAHAAIDWMTDAHKVVSELSQDGTAKLGPTPMRTWSAYMGKVTKAIESGESIELHTALDGLKRFVGQEAQFGKGPFGLSTAAREFDHLYQGENGLKQLLESSVWGDDAASAQRSINAATHGMLSEGKLFTRKFTTEFGSDAGRPLYTADTPSVSGFMNRLTSAANDLDAKGLESFVRARRGFLDAVDRSYTFDKAGSEAIAKERSALDRMDSVYKQTSKDVTLANQVKSALQEERERGIGGALGAVIDIANKPYTTLQRLAQLEGHANSVIGKITGGASALVDGGSAASRNISGIAAKPATIGRGFFSTMLDAFSKSTPSVAGAAPSSNASYARKADAIGAMAGNPIAVTNKVADALAPFGNAAPKTVAAATGVALRGVNFLATKLPPSRQDQYSLQPQLQPKTRASDAEISKFMRYAQAVDDPVIVLREAKSGMLTRDHVEAVKAVYPELYDEMRSQIMRSLVAAKTELPYPRRIQLGILLDIPTDKTLSPDFMRAIQATFQGADQAGAEQPPMTGTFPDLAGSEQTATQMAAEPAS